MATHTMIFRWRRLSAGLFLVLLLCVLSLPLVNGQGTEADVEDEILNEILSATHHKNDDEPPSLEEVLLDEPQVEEDEEIIKVNDYLETLGTAELRAICVDRGFEIAPRLDGLPLERGDYLEAARRCLSLEDEMNAILAQNPELAAELEAEIVRMQQHKQRLEEEREALLREKALLEQQLQQAGVDLLEATTISAQKQTDATVAQKKDPSEMTFKEVLIETFSQLYDRVRQDMEFVWRVAGPFLKPVVEALKFVWRHARPHLISLWKEASKRVKQLLGMAQSRIQERFGGDED